MNKVKESFKDRLTWFGDKLNVEEKGFQHDFELSALLYLEENDCH